jgi:hypothetical protein
MTTLTADSTMQAALSGLKDKTEVRDADGNVIGYFTPGELEIERIYQWAATHFDPEEIRRRLREEPIGSPLADVMRRIQERENKRCAVLSSGCNPQKINSLSSGCSRLIGRPFQMPRIGSSAPWQQTPT